VYIFKQLRYQGTEFSPLFASTINKSKSHTINRKVFKILFSVGCCCIAIRQPAAMATQLEYISQPESVCVIFVTCELAGSSVSKIERSVLHGLFVWGKMILIVC
jgi:hypothetical protein